jgi:hypothetical protein
MIYCHTKQRVKFTFVYFNVYLFKQERNEERYMKLGTNHAARDWLFSSTFAGKLCLIFSCYDNSIVHNWPVMKGKYENMEFRDTWSF